jgi:tellurite resistance protein TehA-like permease
VVGDRREQQRRLSGILLGVAIAAYLVLAVAYAWLIPLLAAFGAWRHVLRRMPLAYEPAWWSAAFPLGMYGVASHELGVALNLPWLVTVGRDEAWAALAVWAAVFLAMTAAVLRGLVSDITHSGADEAAFSG